MLFKWVWISIVCFSNSILSNECVRLSIVLIQFGIWMALSIGFNFKIECVIQLCEMCVFYFQMCVFNVCGCFHFNLCGPVWEDVFDWVVSCVWAICVSCYVLAKYYFNQADRWGNHQLGPEPIKPWPACRPALLGHGAQLVGAGDLIPYCWAAQSSSCGSYWPCWLGQQLNIQKHITQQYSTQYRRSRRMRRSLFCGIFCGVICWRIFVGSVVEVLVVVVKCLGKLGGPVELLLSSWAGGIAPARAPAAHILCSNMRSKWSVASLLAERILLSILRNNIWGGGGGWESWAIIVEQDGEIFKQNSPVEWGISHLKMTHFCAKLKNKGGTLCFAILHQKWGILRGESPLGFAGNSQKNLEF